MIEDKSKLSSLPINSGSNNNEEPDTTFFLFINSGSGGGLGAKIV